MSPSDVQARVAEQLPEPAEGGYKYSLLVKIAQATEAAIKKLLGPHKEGLPPVVVPPNPTKGDRWEGKLPLQVMVPALLLIDLAVSIGGPAGERYKCDPAELATDDGLDTLLAKLRLLASDKAIQKAIEGEMAPPEAPKKAKKASAEEEMDEGEMPEPPKDAMAYR